MEKDIVMIVLGIINLVVVGFLVPLNTRVKAIEDKHIVIADLQAKDRLHVSEAYVKKRDLEKQLESMDAKLTAISDSVNKELKELAVHDRHIRNSNHQILNILNGMVNKKYMPSDFLNEDAFTRD